MKQTSEEHRVEKAFAFLVTEDENGKQVMEFKDKQGRVILKKVQLLDNVNGGPVKDDGSGRGYDGWLCTYYIYDELGQLRGVIQPEGVKALVANNWDLTYNNGMLLKEQCFLYEYDSKGRMVMKKVPGKGTEYMVYDKRDRLVFNTDGNMQAKNWWYVTTYDLLNRPIMAGIMNYQGSFIDLNYYLQNVDVNSSSSVAVQGSNFSVNSIFNSREIGRASYQAAQTIEFADGFATENGAEFTAEIVNGSYAPTSIAITGNPLPPNSTFTPLTLTFYDDYKNTSKTYNSSNNSKVTAGSNLYSEALPATASALIKGMVTSTKVWVMEDVNDLSNGKWQETANFFDDKGRLVQVLGDNCSGGNEELTNLYDFSGKVLCTYQTHNNPLSSIGKISVTTAIEYDAMGRLLSLKKTVNDGGATSTKTIVQNEYDALGQLKKKTLGNALETLDYQYNVRGWLLGVNKDFISNNNSTKKFGFELAYDKPTPLISSQIYTSQLNGNISGTIWKSAGDREIRRYDYKYDNVTRLVSADFNQLAGNTFDKTSQLDFSVSNLSYDDNGNILTQKQRGWKVGGSIDMDDMLYQYKPNSNQLLSVTESPAINRTDNKLGDFTDKNRSNDDYDYDFNGNLKLDRNKSISSIAYNQLNLPSKITTDKGTITYTYDASGNKLKKTVQEGANTTSTTYIGGFIYESKNHGNDDLQFLSMEEGRIRPVKDANNNVSSFNFDYFIKDHLGNIRMVLTDEAKQDPYPAATMEMNSAAVEEALYSNLNTTRVDRPADFPTFAVDPSQYPANSLKVAKVNGSGNRIGPAIVLKVMAGDKFNVKVNSWYLNTGKNGLPITTPGAPVSALTDLVTALTNNIPSASHGIIAQADMNNINIQLQSQSQQFLSGQSSYETSRPKAFLNWILFDDQMKFVSESSNFDQVPDESYFSNGTLESRTYQHLKTDLPITKNGFLYVYVSNETPNIDVYFDNLQVTHIHGPIVEETHYYPFGLAMAGISSKAVAFGSPNNKNKFNHGNELQSNEFSDGSGLEMYDAVNRMYDPQLGRFGQADEFAESNFEWTPYSFAVNNPILRNDPFGLKDSVAGNGEHVLANVTHPEVVVVGIPKAFWAKQRLYYNIMSSLQRQGGTIDQIQQDDLR
jgi:RHS repeat-associated protein